jgi:hypothetical protein
MIVVLAATAWSSAAVTPEQIDNAIERGKKFLYSQQDPSGRWEKDPVRVGIEHKPYPDMQGGTFGGYTALCTYALLAAGESPNTPRIKAAVEFLKHADIVGVYAVAMRLQVWLLIPHDTSEIKALIRRDAESLLNGINHGKEGVPARNEGLWDYLGKGDRVDHSVSQYGVLGLWAAQQSGALAVSQSQWHVIEKAWRRDQSVTGGWSYDAVDNPTIAMSAAGLATLFITADYLHAEDGVACTGFIRNPWIERGLSWIEANYDQLGDNGYAMYGIERIGMASGYKYFRSRDWFTDISERLVTGQEAGGSFPASYVGASSLDATAFGLLCLTRGRAGVVMNKLDYRLVSPQRLVTTGTDGKSKPVDLVSPAATQPLSGINWNERPRDLANLAQWIGHQTETYRNWQIVTLLQPAEELHDAPMLYMSGNEGFTLRPEDLRLLKRFVQQGGMILGNADCGRAGFTKSFEELGRALFGGSFRELPEGHPIYTHQQFPGRRWRVRPSVLGLGNGVRELMILIPDADLARWWQNPMGANGHEDAFELGIDIYQYSLDRQLWNKGTSFVIVPNPAIVASRRIRLARLAIGPNWDPEPGGWARLAGLLHNEDKTDLSLVSVTPGQGGLAAARIAHLTGTTDFTFTNPVRFEIQNFVKQGGSLIVDAAGGSQAFADAAERELQKTFGSYAAAGLTTPVSESHPMYKLPSHPLTKFEYRSWARTKLVGGLKEPRIRVMEIDGRPAVYFSREDLSAGLVGQPVDGVIGYTPETATAIMRNIILYASEAKAKAPGK